MIFLVYKITNLINDKEYIGIHKTDDVNDSYMGSGNLIKIAIKKYGKENFKKDILKTFDTEDEALQYERYLVNEEYVNNLNTYNIALGGKDNPHYGVKLVEDGKNDDILNFIHKVRNNMSENDDLMIDGIRYFSVYHAKTELKLQRMQLYKKLLEDGNGFINKFKQDYLIKIMAEKEERRRQNNIAQGIRMKERVTGTHHSEEHKRKIGESQIGKKCANPQNKDPEKIRKMAEKHRGMKRSKEACINISEAVSGRVSLFKGKKRYYHPETMYEIYCSEDEIPEGYIKGQPSLRVKEKGFYVYNPETLEELYLKTKDCEIPEGFIKGSLSLKKRVKGKCYYYNKETLETILIDKNETPPDGYVKGMKPQMRYNKWWRE